MKNQDQKRENQEVTWGEIWKVLAGGLVMLGLLGWGGWWVKKGLPDGQTKMWVMNVGQGNAILWQGKRGATVLIDGGPDDSLLVRLAEILPWWERKIDLLVVTHPHSDHFWGLLDLVSRWEIGEVLIPNVAGGDAGWEELMQGFLERGVKVNLAEMGSDWKLDEWTKLDVMWPFGKEAFRMANGNNASLLLKMEVCEDECKSVLMVGDAEEEMEQKWLENGLEVKADWLIVGHHGSKTSSGTGFLAAVDPEMAVISVGTENAFGHPDPVILERLEKQVGAENVHRTDLEGTVEIDL